MHRDNIEGRREKTELPPNRAYGTYGLNRCGSLRNTVPDKSSHDLPIDNLVITEARKLLRPALNSAWSPVLAARH